MGNIHAPVQGGKALSISNELDAICQVDALPLKELNNNVKKFYIESYGCAMNLNDSEIVAAILAREGFGNTTNFFEADLILINTCSIRENAEERIRARLREFKKAKKENRDLVIAVLGCMAERLKAKLLEEEKLVDIVVGPDAYRDLPILIAKADAGEKGVNVLLSRDETYADINPVRLSSNGVNAFVSITRGCNNMCAFCVVPFTRGRERSRPADSIVAEAQGLFNEGYREVTLLGQNVDSYHYINEEQNVNITFAQLLEKVALIDPRLRVRFSTSHPKDMKNDVLHIIAQYHNICNNIHLPVQHGNSRILELMNRTYDRAWYMDRIAAIRSILPDCGISTDIITGFCSETEDEHRDTLSLMREVGYEFAYMFAYSERPGTLAHRKYSDDIPEDVKKRRLAEVIELQLQLSHESNLRDINKITEVLIEGDSKKSNLHWQGRNPQNKVVVFPKDGESIGDYIMVKIINCTQATLIGEKV